MASLIPDGDAAPRTNPDEAALRQHLRQNARAASHTLNQRAAARRRARREMDDLEAEFADETDVDNVDIDATAATAAAAAASVRARLKALADRWESDLFDSVMPFWMKHSIDDEHGGYFTCLDHDGSVYDQTKYAWLQGRQVYMLARLYNEAVPRGAAGAVADTRATWLRAAAAGVAFLDHARDPETGLLFFSTTRDGSARLHLQRKPYAGVFYVQGMLEFWRALQTHKKEGSPYPDIVALEARADEFLAKAHQTFKDLDAWIRDPSLCGRPVVPAAARDGRETRLADVMCMASLALDFLKAGATSGGSGGGGGGGGGQDAADEKESYLKLIREAMENCERHYDIRRGGPPGVLLELCSGDGLRSDSPAGRLFSPGHSIEVAWFLLMMCDAVGGSPKHEKLALEVLEGSLAQGWDEEGGGGLLYAIDVEGMPLLDATVTADGKLWWPHSEALIALTMAATRTGEEKWLRLLEKVHAYTYKTFVDRAGGAGGGKVGGWYGYCNRDGSLARTCVGGNYKGCFHVPRALLMCTQMVRAATGV